jgi:hypothetical protein
MMLKSSFLTHFSGAGHLSFALCPSSCVEGGFERKLSLIFVYTFSFFLSPPVLLAHLHSLMLGVYFLCSASFIPLNSIPKFLFYVIFVPKKNAIFSFVE